MNKLLLLILFFATSVSYSQNSLFHIDSFKVKYVERALSKPRYTDYNICAGIMPSCYQLNNRKYDKLILGDSTNSVIALVRQDSNQLYYVDISDVNEDLNLACKDSLKEKVLLYFDKGIGEKWNVHIAYSHFWRRQITYVGTESFDGENVYVYDVNASDGYSDIGNHIIKIYYSRKRGFVKFFIRTHWLPSVEIGKIKSQ